MYIYKMPKNGNHNKIARSYRNSIFDAKNTGPPRSVRRRSIYSMWPFRKSSKNKTLNRARSKIRNMVYQRTGGL